MDEKTLQEHIKDLKVELKSLNKRLCLIRNSLTIAQEKLSLPCEEEDISNIEQEQDFIGMTINDAACQFLREQGKPCSIKKIAFALQSRGIKSNSKTFMTNIISVISRKKDIVNIGHRLWSLNK